MSFLSKFCSLPIIAFLIISIFSLPGLGDEIHEDPVFSSPTRAETGTPDTHLFLDGSDDNAFTVLENISSEDGKTFTMERNDHETMISIPSSPFSTRDVQGRRTVTTYDNVTYFTYLTVDQYNRSISFYFIAYRELEDHFEDPMLIHTFNDTVEGYISIAAGNDELYMLMSPVFSRSANSGVYAKVVPVESWYLAYSFDAERLDIDGDVSTEIAIVSTSIGSCAMWRSDSGTSAIRSVYSDGIWSEEAVVRTTVGSIALTLGIVNGMEKVILVFSLPDDPYVNVTMSENGGITFGWNYIAGDPGNGITSVSVACNNGVIHISALKPTTNKIYHFMSNGGTSWVDSGVIASYSQPSPGIEEVAHLAMDRDNVLIVYQDGSGISGIMSRDGGNSFQKRYDHSSSAVHSPSIQINKDYLAYHDGSDMIILRYILEANAAMTSGLIRPMGVWSWESIGIDVQGIDHGTSLSLRVVDQLGTQLFPSSGWEDITTHGEGDISDRTFDHLIQMEGAWSEPGTDVGSISFEFYMDRDVDDDPVISCIGIDHMTIFPIVESNTEGFHVASIENMTVTSMGIELDANRPLGSVILGPMRKETIWADVMTVRLHSFSNKITLKAGILDMNMDPIPSFGLDDCDQFSEITRSDQIRWNGKHFGIIPDTITSVYIEIELSKTEPTADPYIGSISFEYSKLPMISDVVPPEDSIFRGSSTRFSLVLSDMEDEQDELMLIVQSSLISGNDWTSNDHITGVLWNGSGWDVTFSPPIDTDTGAYGFRAFITDLSGNVSGPIGLPFNIDVLNVKPQPPHAHIEPEIIRSGSSVKIEIDTLGSDPETEIQSLEYIFRVFKNGEQYPDDGLTIGEMNLSIPPGIVEKGDAWSIEVVSSDGVDESDPFNLSFTVVNTAPAIVDPPTLINMEEDMPLLIQPGPLSWFNDIDPDTLELTLEIFEGADIEVTGDSYTIVPWDDYFGSTTLIVTAFDGVVNVTIDIDLEISPVNDPPILRVPSNLSVKQGEWILVDIFASDLLDMDILSVRSNIFNVIPGTVLGENVLEYPNGSIYLRADNRMIGSHVVLFNVSDGVTDIEGQVTIDILNINDPPTMPSITTDPAELIYIGPTEYVLSANSSDLDVQWGDELTYQWTSSIQGDLGTGEMITVTLDPGLHEITVEVSDIDGSVNSTTIELLISEEVNDKDDVMRTNILLIILGVIGLLIGLLIGALIFFLSKRKKEVDGESSEPEKKMPEDKEKATEIDSAANVCEDTGEGKKVEGPDPQQVGGGELKEGGENHE